MSKLKITMTNKQLSEATEIRKQISALKEKLSNLRPKDIKYDCDIQFRDCNVSVDVGYTGADSYGGFKLYCTFLFI